MKNGTELTVLRSKIEREAEECSSALAARVTELLNETDCLAGYFVIAWNRAGAVDWGSYVTGHSPFKYPHLPSVAAEVARQTL